MPSYSAWITTPLTCEQAFSRLGRFDRATEWDPSVDNAEMLTPLPVGRGSRFLLRVRFLGRSLPLEYEVVDFEPPDRMAIRAENRFVRSIDTITFESLRSLTEVGYEARLEPKGLSRIAGPALAILFRRIGDHAAAGLRRYLSSAEAT